MEIKYSSTEIILFNLFISINFLKNKEIHNLLCDSYIFNYFNYFHLYLLNLL